MFVACVKVSVLPEHVEAFVEAILDNARNTRKEPGNIRFDVLRAIDNPAKFFLYEVYKSEADLKAHQQTEHYLRWRERVAPMMAEPRVGEKYENIFPEPWG
jgi:(4S)-4-hydroxy-5-phosphonooxypentane-2,3-dione isomerase